LEYREAERQVEANFFLSKARRSGGQRLLEVIHEALGDRESV
jgi:hypothetical protein